MDSLKEESGYFIVLELELEVRMFLRETIESTRRSFEIGGLRRKIETVLTEKRLAFTSLPC